MGLSVASRNPHWRLDLQKLQQFEAEVPKVATTAFFNVPCGLKLVMCMVNEESTKKSVSAG